MDSHILKKPFLFLSLTALAFGAVGCGSGGSGGFVKKVELKTYLVNGDVYFGVTVNLNTGSIQLPTLTIPILHPDSGEAVGEVGFQPGSSSGTDLLLAVNFNKVSNLPSGAPLLPNGKTIPIGGLDNTSVFVVPVGGNGGRAYLGLSDQKAFMGVAVPIKNFDQIGKVVGGLDVFLPFTIKKISGTAGVFTSPVAGQSGIAVFVDASSLLDSSVGNGITLASAGASSWEFKKLGYSKSEKSRKQKFDEKILKLNQNKAKLQVIQ